MIHINLHPKISSSSKVMDTKNRVMNYICILVSDLDHAAYNRL